MKCPSCDRALARKAERVRGLCDRCRYPFRGRPCEACGGATKPRAIRPLCRRCQVRASAERHPRRLSAGVCVDCGASHAGHLPPRPRCRHCAAVLRERLKMSSSCAIVNRMKPRGPKAKQLDLTGGAA